jgi:N-acetylneuraminic acid mutarotase
MGNSIIELEDYWNHNKLTDNHPFIRAAAAHCLNKGQDKLYLYGGFDREFKLTNDLFVINTDDLSIKKQISLNIEKRLNPQMYYHNNSIFIAGGSSFDYSKPVKLFNEIIIVELSGYKIRKIEIENIGLRFASFFDYENCNLYYVGGLDKDNNKVNIETSSVEKVRFEENIYFPRCGSTALSYQKKAILFSGFRNENNAPKCYSDYYTYNLEEKTMKHNECNEFVGRTFSKAVLIEKYNAILFVFGTYNGMETSRSIIMYDYQKDIFDDLHIQEIPVAITEGIIFYLERKKKLYIAGGLTHDISGQKIYDILWELNIDKIMEKRI